MSSRPSLRWFSRWLWRHRWPVGLGLAALLIRLYWNLVVHPPGDYLYSDMGGYLARARGALQDPLAAEPEATLYPWGTHVLLASIQAVFGPRNFHAVGVVYAVLGASIPVLTWKLARSCCTARWVAPLAGLSMVVHQPLIDVGGYILSEVPYTVCLLGSAVSLLQVVRTGSAWNAWRMGTYLAVGLVFRPQILLVVGLIVVFWVLARNLMGRLGPRQLAMCGAPLLIVASLSAARFHHHTGRVGLVSSNAPLNLMFGRCHAVAVEAISNDGHHMVRFQPPALLQLRTRIHRNPHTPWRLDPALEYTVRYRGSIIDRSTQWSIVQRCIRSTTPAVQARHTATNVSLLWFGNRMWPGVGHPRFSAWLAPWRIGAQLVLCPALLATLVLPWLARGLPRSALIAVYPWSLLLTAGLFFGSIRLRVPYDPIVVVLGLHMLAVLLGKLKTRRRAQVAGAE